MTNRFQQGAGGYTGATDTYLNRWATTTNYTKYYTLGSPRVAVRRDRSVFYLLTDRLGSTRVTTEAAGRGKILPIRVLDTPAPSPLYCSCHRVTGLDGA